MMAEFSQHKLAYGLLVMGLVSLVVLFMAAWPSRFYQRLVICLIVLFYVIWGSLTHLRSAHLNRRIISEYLGLATLGGLIIWLLT